jgi:hypothetical protein
VTPIIALPLPLPSPPQLNPQILRTHNRLKLKQQHPQILPLQLMTGYVTLKTLRVTNFGAPVPEQVPQSDDLHFIQQVKGESGLHFGGSDGKWAALVAEEGEESLGFGAELEREVADCNYDCAGL